MMCFRALHGAASLKPVNLDLGDEDVVEFPRPSWRGLIEAIYVSSEEGISPCFRALHGAASLKRPAHPRIAQHGAGFRALHGAASLKQGMIWSLQKSFRALHGAASLKRAGVAVGRVVLLGFPRPSWRGLIEARRRQT